MSTDPENDIKKCLEVLKQGGIILYPTDTIWGIGCDATNVHAVDKIYKLKKRGESKAMIVLVAGERDIRKYVSQPNPGLHEYLESALLPTTVIYDGAVGLAENLLAADGSAAIRVVKDDFCKRLIKRFGTPITSSSANISGTPAPENFQQVQPEIKNGVDYIVQHRQNDHQKVTASSIIKWEPDGTVRVIRN